MNGPKIRELRKQRNLTLEELSKLTGISLSRLSEYETGIATSMNSTKLKALCKALHCKAEDIL